MPTLPCLLLLALSTDQPNADWNRFRGPEGRAVLAERQHPERWDAQTNIAWSIDVGGSGWSSPIVVDGKVYLTAAHSGAGEEPAGFTAGASDPSTYAGAAKPEKEWSFHLSCRSLADGKELWTREVGKRVPPYGVHKSNTFATETPATDGERIFVTFGGLGELVAFDLDGKQLWRVETGVFKTGNDFGWGISLVAADGAVYFQSDNEESSYIAAFDAATGEERWRADRAQGTSWGTPILTRDSEPPVVIACGPDTVTAYRARDGVEVWKLQGVGGSFASSPTIDDERVYFGNSGPMSRGPLIAVPRDAQGVLDLAADEPPPIAWKADRSGPGFASPVAYDGLVYVLGSTAVLACHDAATGERLWRERLPDAAQVVASPWVAGDALFILDEAGTTFVIDAGRDFKLRHTNSLPGLYWGTPSVAGDALLLRDATRLYCIRE